MPITLPFLPSRTNYTLACPIDDEQILFDVRWNSRDAGWYLDMYEADDTVIAINIKVVTGIVLGKPSIHPFFETHIMMAVDTSGQELDPGFDDLGTRVVVVIQTPASLA